MRKLLMSATVIAVLSFHGAPAPATDVTFSGRTWQTNDPDPVNPPTYSGAGNTGTITGAYGPEATIATPISIAVGDSVSYDLTLTNPASNNWVGDAWGDFRGGNMLDTANFSGYLISGRVGYRFDFGDGSSRTLRFQDAGFNLAGPTSNAGTEESPGINVTWTFPTTNSYQVTARNIGSSTALLHFAGSTGGNAITDVTFFRHELNDTLQTATLSNFGKSTPGSLVFSFEGGVSAQGFKLLQAPGSVTTWTATSATIDIGDGFNLLSATNGSDRVVVDPYSARDNFGHGQHKTMVLRSPSFTLDGSGSLAVDMLGGRKYGENGNAAENALPDPAHIGELGSLQRNAAFPFGDAGEVNDGKHLQGFALRDALTGQYVLIGSKGATNDGKMRETDPFDRGAWETASFTAEQLAPFANNGRRYEIDFIDSFGESSWGHIGFDNLRVPGVLSALAPGDADGDGLVNNADSSTVFNNFTGTRGASPFTKADGLARVDGDFDGNGDVDGGDVLEHIANIGLTAPTAGSARLIYDSSNGSVTLDATGADGDAITAFRLLSDPGAALATGVASFPTAANPLATDTATEIFWADTALTGFAGAHNLGAILASGLDLTEVQSALSSALYVGAAGTGVFNFATGLAGDFNADGFVDGDDLDDPVDGWKARFGDDLDGSDFLVWQRNLSPGVPLAVASTHVPEPSTALLALMCVVGAMCITRRRAAGLS